jgi:Flp pilus assembly pilin Flp
MKRLWGRFVQETEGQDLIEYALLGATIAIGVALAMQGVRGALQTKFNTVSAGIVPGP